ITPLQANESNLITQRMTHDRLMRVSPEGLPEPWLATDLEISEDQTSLTMPLRDDVEFHDGTKFIADDVKFTFDYLKEYKNPFFSSAVAPIEETVVEDDYRVTVNLTEPFAPIKMLTLARVHMLPQHVWEDIPESVGVEKPFQYAPTESETGLVGSGPFKFVEWRKGEGIMLEANKDHPVAPPKVDRVFLRSVPNPSAMLTGAQNKDIDFIIRASSIQTDALEKAIADNDHLEMVRTNSVGYDEWSMNTTKKPLDDPAIRGAMSAMIPKDVIATEIWNDYAIPAHSPTSPVLEFWHNADVKKWPEEGREGAIRILEEAGYVIKDDGIYYPAE
ncbi:MAG: ABC transporter substrate-binding protein, partial [Halobacteriales archaeon]|nr:ABC transporter substrate-binding protein [Halobacteriales archaeon]